MTDNAKTKVLVVEDDQEMLDAIKVYLETEGYNVLTATSQKEAEALLKPSAFDAAIVGLMLENRDSGFVLSYKIKKMNKALPVIIITSATKETGFNFDKASDPKSWIKADVIIHKELRLEQLKTELERLLGEVAAHA